MAREKAACWFALERVGELKRRAWDRARRKRHVRAQAHSSFSGSSLSATVSTMRSNKSAGRKGDCAVLAGWECVVGGTNESLLELGRSEVGGFETLATFLRFLEDIVPVIFRCEAREEVSYGGRRS